MKTRTVAIGPALPPKTQHLNLTILPPIKYRSSDHIVTWLICRLCRINRSFTSNVYICDPTNIRLVALKNPPISPKIVCSFKATKCLLVGSPIWTWEVKEWVILHHLHIDHITIRSQLIYLIGAKVAGPGIWDCSPVTTRSKNRGSMSSPGNNPTKTMTVGFLARSGTKPNGTTSQNPDRWRVTRTRC